LRHSGSRAYGDAEARSIASIASSGSTTSEKSTPRDAKSRVSASEPRRASHAETQRARRRKAASTRLEGKYVQYVQ
jgi:hypothetical protein